MDSSSGLLERGGCLSASSPSHSIGRRESIQMDCCAHEGPAAGDARFDLQRVADGVHVAVAAPAYKVNSNTAIIESDDGVLLAYPHPKPSPPRSPPVRPPRPRPK